MRQRAALWKAEHKLQKIFSSIRRKKPAEFDVRALNSQYSPQYDAHARKSKVDHMAGDTIRILQGIDGGLSCKAYGDRRLQLIALSSDL